MLDGPLLVLAGPGTGKTQLLSARVANILARTDTLPQNILCLTFTENGARNMQDRLSSMIGSSAYDVHISTYHSFGSDIIRAYPDYFTRLKLQSNEDSRLEKPIDDLTKTQIVEAIVTKLEFDDPLRSARYYIKSVVGTISELKRGLVTPADLIALADANIAAITAVSPAINDIYGPTARMPKLADALPLFTRILLVLQKHDLPLCTMAADELSKALQTAEVTGKTNSLTQFKKDWLYKNENAKWELDGQEAAEKMRSLAVVYTRYQNALQKQSLYDFDDMILRTLEALETHKDLLYTLQETYQYILLDEFQDTNASQFKLVQMLADNPVNEGRPNTMAVGDDDQAIYAFQGAEIGNMSAFLEAFRDVKVINLTQNYRSHDDILFTAKNVAEQIESRLHHSRKDISKTLYAASTHLPKNASLERLEFASEADEYAWVAHKINKLLQDGVSASDIAVLSPKHARLGNMVPFLNDIQIPVAYEKRENILDTPMLRSLELMSRLILALHRQDVAKSDELFPIVASLDFWQIPVDAIWHINWQAAKYDEKRSWAELALTSDILAPFVQFFLKLGLSAAHTPLEHMLDYLTGATPLVIQTDESYISPFKEYYFSPKARADGAQNYFEAISHLSVIRSRLRDYQNGSESILNLQDFITFIDMYRSAEQPLINSHPLAQADDSVQLMTVYKAKGLEFAHVFLLSVHDDIWGKKARSNSNKIGLPANLQAIRYQGSSEDELRRLLFVAITRAKHGLYLTSHAQNDSGKLTEPVKYLLESEQEGTRRASAMPAHAATVTISTHTGTHPQRAIELLWQQRHVLLDAPLKNLLKSRLDKYKMSPTHLNTFIDTEYGGPEAFLLRTLLRFPQAPTVDSEFGSAVHGVLDWYQKQIAKGSFPTLAKTLAEFDRELKSRYITSDDYDYCVSKGHSALSKYLTARGTLLQNTHALSEVDFAREGVLINDTAHITGKIDRLEIDTKAKTIHIVDFKTGKPASSWAKELKYLKYRQQLYFYKLLIEGSHTYKGYKVVSGRLEFVEPNMQGGVAEPLVVMYDQPEADELKKLILVVWQKIQNLQLDDTSNYSTDYKGATAFIQSLLLEQ